MERAITIALLLGILICLANTIPSHGASDKSESRRVKRGLSPEDLKKLLDQLKKEGNVGVSQVCPSGSEQRTQRGYKICYVCPPGYFWHSNTYKCTLCPLGSYSIKNGTLNQCTNCPQGTTTKDQGTDKATLCIEQCPPGFYSKNGLAQPVTCKPCLVGSYSPSYAATTCSKCPNGQITSGSGSSSSRDCKTACQPGFYSSTGVAPCVKCPTNKYQPLSGRKSCINCPYGKSTLASGSTSLNQCVVKNECNSNPCMNGGQCVDGVNSYTCRCAPGFRGDRCETNIDECASKPCFSGGSCVDKVNGFQCICPPGYTGQRCNIDINECVRNPCNNGGTCNNLAGSYECSCAAGYGGQNCQVNQDDCSPGVCANGGKCVDKLNGFTCKCAPGFRGEQCTENIDDCASSPCKNGGKCVDGVNGYKCACAKGYSGQNCDKDIDECSWGPCANRGACTNIPGGHKCTCTNYWGGDSCNKKLSDCFNLDMNANTIEDYVAYQPGRPVPSMGEITVRFSMRSNDRGLQAHVGSIISYGLPGKEGLFSIQAFPEQMLEVNGENWLTGVDMTNNQWNSVCMTWRASDGLWRAYAGSGTSLKLVSNDADASRKAMSKRRYIPGGGKFVLGQLYQGSMESFNPGSVYRGELYGVSIWYDYDMCNSKKGPNIAWPNLVYNGDVKMTNNKRMIVTRKRMGGGC